MKKDNIKKRIEAGLRRKAQYNPADFEKQLRSLFKMYPNAPADFFSSKLEAAIQQGIQALRTHEVPEEEINKVLVSLRNSGLGYSSVFDRWIS